jgi:hypothetical protein
VNNVASAYNRLILKDLAIKIALADATDAKIPLYSNKGLLYDSS